MKLIAPKYYKEFKCIADKCKHNCCREGWEIDIDKKTAEYYKSLPGELGDKLRKNINFSDTCSFILDENNTCPFLNKKGLCSLYLTLGAEHMGQICTDHPRYFEWFENEKEAGIGLCCEEAARIILSQNNKFETYDEVVDEDGIGNYENDLYIYLKKVRKIIINFLDNNFVSLNKKLLIILNNSKIIQENIDNYNYDLEIINELFDEKNYNNYLNNYKKLNENNRKNNLNNLLNNYLEHFINLEFNKESWPEYLKNNKKYLEIYFEEKDFFERNNSEIINYLKNISIYFIWRYYIKGTFDEEILSRIKFMIISNIIIEFLFYCEYKKNNNKLIFENIIDVVRRYSEEVEYSDDNMNKLADDTYELRIFSIENLSTFLNNF